MRLWAERCLLNRDVFSLCHHLIITLTYFTQTRLCLRPYVSFSNDVEIFPTQHLRSIQEGLGGCHSRTILNRHLRHCEACLTLPIRVPHCMKPQLFSSVHEVTHDVLRLLWVTSHRQVSSRGMIFLKQK